MAIDNSEKARLDRLAREINPEKARRHLEEADLTKRSAGRKSLLKISGASGIGGRKGLETVYALRRAKLKELSGNMRKLLLKPIRSKKISEEIDKLAREIKAVAVTDPRITFPKRKKGQRVVKLDVPNSGKYTYFNEGMWRTAKEPFNSHHIRGLDKYFNAFINAGDEELAIFHLDSAKKGIYFGNHPLNKIDIHKAHHLGQSRRLMLSSESIHGLIDWKDISDDDFWVLMTEAIGKTETDIMDLMYDPRVAAKGSKITPGSRKVGEGFIRKPLPEFNEFTDLTQPRIQEQIFEMAVDDTRALDNILKQPINPRFWEGDIAANVKRFALQHREELLSDPAKYKPITDAIASGKKIPKATLDEWGELFGKSAYRSLNRTQPGFYSGLPLGTLQDHIETAKDIIGRTPKGRLVRGAAVVGGVTLRGLPILGAGIDAYVAGEAWHKAKQDPSVKNIGAAFGESAILLDQVTPFGAVGQMANQVIRQYTDPERGTPKIRGRSGAKRAIEAKKLEQKQLQARFIPSKEQEEWWSQSFTSKPWLTR